MPNNASDQSMIDGAAGLIGTAKVAPPAPSPATPVASVTPAAPVAQVIPVVEPTPTISPIVVKSAFGEQVYGGTPIAQVDLKTFQDVQKFTKDYLGVELKEVKDFVPFLAQVKTMQEQAAQTTELQKVVDNYKTNLESLPKEVVLILDTAISGGDYKSVIGNLQKKSATDYTKLFASHDPIALANQYTNKSYTKETFDALDESSRGALLDGIKVKFDADRDSVLNFETNNRIAIEQKQKAFSASIDASISNLLTSNPRMDKAAVGEIKKAMLYGLSDSLFTKDKTYAPDAAEKIAMMLYGKQHVTALSETIGDLVKKSTNASKTEEIQKILLRSDKPPLQSGAPASNVAAQIVAEATSWLPKRK